MTRCVGPLSLLYTIMTCPNTQVWTFVLKDATFKMDQDTIGPLEKSVLRSDPQLWLILVTSTDRVKIVACKGVAPDAKA